MSKWVDKKLRDLHRKCRAQTPWIDLSSFCAEHYPLLVRIPYLALQFGMNMVTRASHADRIQNFSRAGQPRWFQQGSAKSALVEVQSCFM